MAKKTSKPATKSKTKPAAKKTKKPAKPREVEIDVDEAKAIELVQSSDKVCAELEEAVTLAILQAARKLFKKHSIALTADQTEKVAFLLFGD
jgi:hypothetical protein